MLQLWQSGRWRIVVRGSCDCAQHNSGQSGRKLASSHANLVNRSFCFVAVALAIGFWPGNFSLAENPLAAYWLLAFVSVAIPAFLLPICVTEANSFGSFQLYHRVFAAVGLSVLAWKGRGACSAVRMGGPILVATTVQVGPYLEQAWSMS